MSKSHTGRLNIINRDKFPNFQPSPVLEYRTKKRIKSVRAIRVDHDRDYEEAKKKGIQIDITSSDIFVGNNKKPVNGIFSPLFGADTTQDIPIYACECRYLTGGTNLGRLCPECNTVVRSIEADLRLTGYIDIAPYHIMSYAGLKNIGKTISDDALLDIYTSVKKIDRAGKLVKDDKPTIMDLYNDYEDELEERTGIPRNIAFMSKIPVYSARLRPLIYFGSNMTILDVNKSYFSIVKLANELRASPLFNMNRGAEIQRILNQIQLSMNEVYAHVEDQINGKNGAIRKSLASGRIDYSARMVISLGMGLMPHEVDVPYSTMMVMYEEEIANYLSKLENIPLAKAITMVEDNSVERNEKFVKIINQLLKSNYGIWGIINRPPTISESSVQYVRVRKIHDDPTDMTMHMPPDNLPLLAADFRLLKTIGAALGVIPQKNTLVNA